MRVLIACEFSGTVRDAFRAVGHEAWSCDLLPTEAPGPHLQQDVREVLGLGWDLLIGHPPCTFLCNSGVSHLHKDPSRWDRLDEGAAFFKMLLEADIPQIAIENPIPHKYALQRIGQKYSQIIHPWQHGHGESKATCLWLKNLPPLQPSHIVEGRVQRLHRLSPSPDRWKLRSATYPGIANAFAAQWGNGVRGYPMQQHLPLNS